MTECEAPLSDLITAIVEGEGHPAYAAFLVALVDARVGLEVEGSNLPNGPHVVGAKDRMVVTLVTAADGRLMLKGCADPAAFDQRFGGVSADMLGRDFLEMALGLEDAEGVLICSAASEHSVPVGRDEIMRVLAGADVRRPWWAFWR